jgi:hypothetical protein
VLAQVRLGRVGRVVEDVDLVRDRVQPLLRDLAR